MIPKIEFRHSHIYDEHFKKHKRSKMASKKILNGKLVDNYILNLNKEWKKVSNKILKELEKTTGLKWKENKIICYIVRNTIPFSDPLTIPVYEKIDLAIDMLTHELIHQIYTQGDNLNIAEKSWEYFFKKYKNEKWSTIIHIPLHAVHTHIYLKFLGEKRLKRNIKLFQNMTEYNLSWEVVQKEGFENIIKDFKKRLK